GLVGSWTTEATMSNDGREAKGKGKTSYMKSVGDTALIQTYEMEMPGPDGKPMTFHGHGVTKLSEDGKTATTWWFDDMSPDAMRLTGPITETGLEISGDSRMGGRVTVTMRKTADGVTFEMTDGAHKMTDLYRRVK